MIDELVVVVPANDEEARIGACLDALAEARALVADRVRTGVVVVLDRCTDATARIVATHPDVAAVESIAGCVGTARAVGATTALDGRDPSRTWLANTDADSTVPVGWLAHQLDLAVSGADLALGTIVPAAGLAPELWSAWRSEYSPVPGHPHVHGANLGVRGDALLALGGWRPLVTDEDVDLAARAVAAGLDVRRSAEQPVSTSVRTVGRAPLGFSSYLRALG
ncbi:glycosyltransferase family 2 protein [Jatrophihabitans fulvus]